MATYREIKGLTVQNLSSDPVDSAGNPGGLDGQIWYNTTTKKLRAVVGLGAWASGTSLPAPGSRYSMPGFGTRTAGALVGGYGPPAGATRTSETTLYDGTTWTLGGNMADQASENGASGPQTAAFTAGGYDGSYVNTSGTFDGSTWTAQGTLVDGSRGFPSNQAGGTASAGVVCGKQDAGDSSHEQFDGSSWTAATDMPGSRGAGGGAGTSTAFLVASGGYPSTSATTATLEWDGSSWTAGGTMNTARNSSSGGPGGSSYNDAWIAGGQDTSPAVAGNMETYDGTTWTAVDAMANGRTNYGSFGTKGAAVVAGGGPAPVSGDFSYVEEYVLDPDVAVAGVWAAGTAYPTYTVYNNTAGTQTAGLGAGGRTHPSGGPGTLTTVTTTNEFDGTTWTGSGALGTGRYGVGASGLGTQTAAFYCGGYEPTISDKVELYDGSTWTANPVMSNTKSYQMNAGTTTSALVGGGQPPTSTEQTLEWNGSAWSSGGDMASWKYHLGGCGTQTAALAAGGTSPTTTGTQEYDGSSWTTVPGVLATATSRNSVFGIQTAAINAGGSGPGELSQTESYDGTSWTTQGSLATGRELLGGTGTTAAGFVVGGQTAPPSTITASVEIYTGATTKKNQENITT